MPKKKVQLRKAGQTRKTNSVPKKTSPSSPQKRYQNTLKAIKAKHGIDHRTAQASYRELKESLGKQTVTRNDVYRHPRLVNRAVIAGTKKAKRATKERKEKRESYINAKAVIDQALTELFSDPSNTPDEMEKPTFDKSGMIVKITIKGRDYTRKITGKIVERTGSKILLWKWKTKHEGKHQKRNRRR